MKASSALNANRKRYRSSSAHLPTGEKPHPWMVCSPEARALRAQARVPGAARAAVEAAQPATDTPLLLKKKLTRDTV